MPECSEYRRVGQFFAGMRAAEHESAAAHVTTTHEIDRKHKSVTEDFKEGFRIFCARDATQQYIDTSGTGVFIDQPRCLQQSITINRIVLIDRDIGDCAKLLDADRRLGRNKSYPGRHRPEPREYLEERRQRRRHTPTYPKI